MTRKYISGQDPFYTLLSIEELARLLRYQSQMRSPENDEAGVLAGLADQLEFEVKELEE